MTETLPRRSTDVVTASRHCLSDGRCSVDVMFESLFDMDPRASEGELRIQVERLEQLKSAAAAAQARATALWSAKRRAAEALAGVPVAKRGRGLAAEVGLARRDSPKKGDRHLGLA